MIYYELFIRHGYSGRIEDGMAYFWSVQPCSNWTVRMIGPDLILQFLNHVNGTEQCCIYSNVWKNRACEMALRCQKPGEAKMALAIMTPSTSMTRWCQAGSLIWNLHKYVYIIFVNCTSLISLRNCVPCAERRITFYLTLNCAPSAGYA